MNGLYDFYSDDLRPVLLEQERSRKKLFSNLKSNIIAVLIFALLIGAYFKWSKGLLLTEVLIATSILATIYIVLLYRTLMKGHQEQVKQNILSRIAKFIDPSLNYRANSRISGIELEASGFFERGSTADMSGEDYISGTVHGLNFMCSEIFLPRLSTEFTDGDLTRLNLRPQGFRGLFAVIRLPKRLDSVIYIFPNSIGGKMRQKFSTTMRLERIKLEDPTFERHFNAYATDQLQSRMVLTTRLIDDITTLRQRVGSDIMLGIQGDKLYIAVSSSKDLFEPNAYESYLNPQHIRNSFKELNIVVQLVKDISEIFKLDTK